MTWLELTNVDLIYRPPRPSTLLNSPGRSWDYQVSPELINILHVEVQKQFDLYKKGYADKSTIPLYLFLSGAGTGKSRNSSELWQTTYRCFNRDYFPRMDEIAHQISNAFFFFHISFGEWDQHVAKRDRSHGYYWEPDAITAMSRRCRWPFRSFA